MSMDLRMNKQVKCISDEYYLLTKGKIYDVIYEYSDCIIVTNDIGFRRKFPLEIFEKVPNKEVIFDKIKPSYYGTGIDVIEFCLRNNLTFMQGNVFKYVTRYKSKNGIEDLEKAKEYIDRLIEFEKRKENEDRQIY